VSESEKNHVLQTLKTMQLLCPIASSTVCKPYKHFGGSRGKWVIFQIKVFRLPKRTTWGGTI